MSLKYDCDLPCEFLSMGCNLSFPGGDYSSWYSHSLSHFLRYEPPPYSICIFCDTEDARFQADHNNDRYGAWRSRLLHIADHFAEGWRIEDMRPDYFLLDYLVNRKIISSHDYVTTISYTERPYCSGLVPLGYQTEEMRRMRARWDPEDVKEQQPEAWKEVRRHQRRASSRQSSRK